MPWLESHTELEGHPKLSAFRKRMRWSKNEAVGFLHRLWWTVLKYAPNGVISALPPEFIADTLGMELVHIQTALTELEAEDVGLLDRKGDVVLVHDWLDYAGRYLRDGKYRSQPEKWKEICEIHSSAADPPLSVRSPPHLPTKNIYIKEGEVGLSAAAKKTMKRLQEQKGV